MHSIMSWKPEPGISRWSGTSPGNCGLPVMCYRSCNSHKINIGLTVLLSRHAQDGLQIVLQYSLRSLSVYLWWFNKIMLMPLWEIYVKVRKNSLGILRGLESGRRVYSTRCVVIFSCWLCACIPFCVDDCKDVIHTCPSCGVVLGRHRRL